MKTPEGIYRELLKISDELGEIEDQIYDFYKNDKHLTLEEFRAIHIGTVFVDEKIRGIREQLDMVKVKGKGEDII